MQNNQTSGKRWTLADSVDLDTVRFRISVARHHIGFVNAIVEGYDNLARVQTEHVEQGVMLLQVPRSCMDVLERVLQDIGRKVELKYLEEE